MADETIVIEPFTSPEDEPLFVEVPATDRKRGRFGVKRDILWPNFSKGDKFTLREFIDTVIEQWDN